MHLPYNLKGPFSVFLPENELEADVTKSIKIIWPSFDFIKKIFRYMAGKIKVVKVDKVRLKVNSKKRRKQVIEA